MDMHSALKLGNLPLRIGHWKAIGKKKKNQQFTYLQTLS